MNTSAKFLFWGAGALGLAIVVVLSISHSHRAKIEVTAAEQIAAPFPVENDYRTHGSLTHRAASARPEQVSVATDSANLDALEDADEIRAWARNHPQSAREWLTRAADGTKRDSVLEMVSLRIAETNAAAAVALVDVYGAGCTNLLENLIAQWAVQDLQAAYNWSAAKPAGAQRDNLFSRIAFVESKTDPEYAANLVAQQIPSGPAQDEAAISVLYQWAQKDPTAAMRWAQSFSSGALHDRAVSEVQNVIASNLQSINTL